MGRLLLDSCALVWLATGDSRLSDEARHAIASSPCVFASPISAWEIGQKHRNGTLQLPMPPEEMFEKIVSRYSLEMAPLDASVMFKAVALPYHHRDPADRFLIATALLNRLTVVTGDRRFPDYGVEIIC